MYNLQIPDDIYQWAQAVAKQRSQSVDEVLMDYVRRVSQSIPVLPADEEAELAALRYLSDDALWTLARAKIAPTHATRMQSLMEKNSAGTISDDEYIELEALVTRGQKFDLRKSEAMAILAERGHSVSLKEDQASD